jgi:integrase
MLPEEFQKFIYAAYEWKPIQGLLWDLIGNGGFRISEALLLRPMDFNWDESIIYITTLKQKNMGSLYGNPEIFKGRDVVPKTTAFSLDVARAHMDPSKIIVIPIMMPHKTMEIARKIINLMDLKKDEHIFKMARIWAWRCFKVISKKAGLSELYSPHALRHCQGIMAANVFKGDIVKVAKRMRHRNPNNVYRYVHLLQIDEKQMIEYLEQQREPRKTNKEVEE